MYSIEDMGRFYFQYQTEALPRGESVQSFCARNKVAYNIFSKWYRDTRSRIVEVMVDGRPEENGAPWANIHKTFNGCRDFFSLTPANIAVPIPIR